MSKRQIDHADAVSGAIGNDPVDPGDHVAGVTSAGAAEHADVHEVDAGRAPARKRGRHTRRRSSAAADDARDVRAMPEGIARDVRLARDEVDARDDAAGKRRMVGDAGIDDGDADAAAAVPLSRQKTQQAPGAGPDGLGAGHLVRDRHVRDDRQVAGEVRDRSVRGERPEILRAQIEGEGSGDLSPEPAAVARAEQLKCALLPLHDDAHLSTARQGRFQIIRKCRPALSLRVGG